MKTTIASESRRRTNVNIATHQALDLRAFHIDHLWAARGWAREIEIAPETNLQVNVRVQSLSSRQ